MIGLVLLPLRLLCLLAALALILLGLALAAAAAAPLLAIAAMVGLALGLLVHLVRPGVVAALMCAVGGPLVLYGFVAGVLSWGRLSIEAREAALREAAQHTHAIELVDDASGEPIGILPVSVMYPNAPAPGYLALDLPHDEIPPAWNICLPWLEDRHLDTAWHIDGVDFWGLLRAYYAKFAGRREGASTLAEMVGRELRAAHPDPAASLFGELPRKITSWGDGPAVTRLFPGETILDAAAVHLPLVIGLRDSAFGAEVHGLALAVQTVFGHRLAAVEPAEAAAEGALFAAAVNRPIAMPAADQPQSVARSQARFAFIKSRADSCLTNAPFPADFDRAEARRQLASLALPVAEFAPPPSHAAVAIAPARHAVDRLGTTIGEVGVELRRAVGAGWQQQVRRAQIVISSPLPDTSAQFAAALAAIQQKYGSRLAIPLWEGTDHALVAGAVVDAKGRIVVQVTNADGGIAALGPQPIGSIGKIVAALVLGQRDAPRTPYCIDGLGCTPNSKTISAMEAFAHSNGPPIFQRLTHRGDSEVQVAFSALGWPVPPLGTARYNAVYGALDVRPEHVLRAAVAVTGVLAAESHDAALPHLVAAIELQSGERPFPAFDTLDIEPLAALMNPRVCGFVEQVLGAPYASGTLRNVGWLRGEAGIAHLWGKTGTANGSDQQSRALWQVGGFSYRGQQMSFLTIVVGSNRAPVGQIEASAVSPLTSVVLHAALRAQGG